MRPQENGGHADVRWLELRDGSDGGYRIDLPVPLQVSVSRFRASDLDEATHVDELRPLLERRILPAARLQLLEDLLELLFVPGFTTRSGASETSGRGVGLDAVKTAIERMRGFVHADAAPGRGMTVTLVLPLTVYVLRALMLRVGAHTLAMPVSAVERLVRIGASDVVDVGGRPAVVVGGRPIAVSNIRWNYGHTTIPRHLRDIVVTEYGVADLRGKSDRDVIAAMLSVTDSHFQRELLRQAKEAGKIEKQFELPATCRDNTPERVARALKPASEQGLLPPFPFGTDFTPVEQRLMPALETLRDAPRLRLARIAARGLFAVRPDKEMSDCLARMALDQPKTLRERLYAALLRGALG